MMPFTDPLGYRFSSRCCGLLCGCLLWLCGALHADHQAELLLGPVWGKQAYGENTLGHVELSATGRYRALFAPHPLLRLSLQDAFALDGATGASALRPQAEHVIPGFNDLTLGLRLATRQTVGVTYRQFLFIDPLPLYVNANPNIAPYYVVDDPGGFGVVHIMRQMRHAASLDAYLPLEKLCLNGDVSIVAHRYSLRSMGWSTNTEDFDSLAGSSRETDTDIWTNVSARYALTGPLTAGGGMSFKKNASGRNSYDMHRYHTRIGSTHKFATRHTLTWSAGAEWLESRIMEQGGYATKLVGDIALRDVWKFVDGWFLKAHAHLRAGDLGMLKLRCETSVRRFWPSESSLEAGYFSALWGLFPTQGPYLRARLHLPMPVSLGLDAKVLLAGPDRQIPTVEYIMTQISPEVLLRLSSPLALVVRMDYRYYEFAHVNGFPTRVSLFGGLRLLHP